MPRDSDGYCQEFVAKNNVGRQVDFGNDLDLPLVEGPDYIESFINTIMVDMTEVKDPGEKDPGGKDQ